jgi:hypothetical protein
MREESGKYRDEEYGGRGYKEGQKDAKCKRYPKQRPAQIFALRRTSLDEFISQWEVRVEFDAANAMAFTSGEIVMLADATDNSTATRLVADKPRVDG